jgi:hypothetical protein
VFLSWPLLCHILMAFNHAIVWSTVAGGLCVQGRLLIGVDGATSSRLKGKGTTSRAAFTNSGRINAPSGITLGSLGEFETCPDWVPTVDKRRRYARSGLKTIDVCGFDQRVNRAAKVRNVSKVGSQSESSRRYAIQLNSLRPFQTLLLDRPHLTVTPVWTRTLDNKHPEINRHWSV